MRRPEDRRIFALTGGKTRFGLFPIRDDLPPVPDEPDDDPDVPAARMMLYDEIGMWGVMAGDFVAEMSQLTGQPLDLHVNSPGGDVFEGLAMLNTLRAYKGKVTAYVDGIAASAASFLLMGADEVVMARNSTLMIHDAWGMCLGNAADMEAMAKTLDRVSDNIADVYASKAGQDVAHWRALMQAETWYDGTEAVAAGLADRASTATQGNGELAYDLSAFRNARTRTPAAPIKPDEPIVTKDDDFDVSDVAALFRQAFKGAA